MSRWSLRTAIEEAAARNGPLAGKFGLYQIRAVNLLTKQIRIGRMAGIDKSGLLYFGRSGYQRKSPNRTIPNRLNEFIKQRHSGGKTYAQAARTMRRENKFPKHRLEVSALSLRDHAIDKAETRQLRRYLRKFGELPPCNSTLPSIKVLGEV